MLKDAKFHKAGLNIYLGKFISHLPENCERFDSGGKLVVNCILVEHGLLSLQW